MEMFKLELGLASITVTCDCCTGLNNGLKDRFMFNNALAIGNHLEHGILAIEVLVVPSNNYCRSW